MSMVMEQKSYFWNQKNYILFCHYFFFNPVMC